MICIYRLGKVETWENAGTRASPNRVVIAAKTFLMERFTGSQSCFSAQEWRSVAQRSTPQAKKRILLARGTTAATSSDTLAF